MATMKGSRTQRISQKGHGEHGKTQTFLIHEGGCFLACTTRHPKVLKMGLSGGDSPLENNKAFVYLALIVPFL